MCIRDSSKLCNVQHTTFSTFHIRTYPFSWLSLRCFLSKMQLTCEFQSLSELKRTFSRWFSLSARKQVSTVHDLRFSNLINFSYSKWIYQSILTQHLFLSRPSAPKSLEDRIDLASKKNNIHTAIQPKHNKDNRRKTSIHIGESFKNIQIDGKDKGKCHPPAGSKESSRQLFPKCSLPCCSTVRKELIYQIPEKCQQRKRKINTQLNNLVNHLA